MPFYDVEGFGRESGLKRKARYWGRDQDDAINNAALDGIVVGNIKIQPPSPPSVRQIHYARDLGLVYPRDITCQELSDMLDRHLADDEPAPEWLKSYARQIGVRGNIDDITDYIGKRRLYNFAGQFLSKQGDVELAAWFTYHVGRDLGLGDLLNDVIQRIAGELAVDKSVMKSMRKLAGDALADFWDRQSSSGNKRTVAYKAAAWRIQSL